MLQQHQARERATSSTTSWNTDWHIYKSLEVFLIINIIIHSREMEWHHHPHQHEAKVTSSSSLV
jgi:hypothetical protein